MRDKIIDYYKHLIAIGWMVSDDEGFVSVQMGDQLLPATIDGKRVFLPTREQMKNKNWENRIGFHPMREAFNLGISDMVACLRDQFVGRLNASIGHLMKELIALAYDQGNQKNLTTEQSQVLNCLTQVSDTTVKQFTALLQKTPSRNDADQFINIFIRRGGEYRGRVYGRAGIVTFPIYDRLVKTKDPVNGVKFSGKDREMLIKLFEFIFPTLASDPETFNVGIDSRQAPFFESLVRVTLNVVEQLVEVSKPYLSVIDMPSILDFPPEVAIWREIFDDRDLAERLAKSIPSMNVGDDEEDEPRKEATEERRTERDRDSEPVREERREEAPAPRGRMTLGAPAPVKGTTLGKSQPDQQKASGTDRVSNSREVRRDSDLDREEQQRRREREEQDRREREREAEEDRERQRRRDREDRERERERERERDRRDRDRRDDRDYRDDRRRDRDYDDRDDRHRDRDRDRRDRDERTGNVFEDNPVLRGNLRDAEDDYRYSRRRDRDRYDDRRDGRRVRDIRDSYRDDRDYDYRDRRDRYYGRR